MRLPNEFFGIAADLAHSALAAQSRNPSVPVDLKLDDRGADVVEA